MLGRDLCISNQLERAVSRPEAPRLTGVRRATGRPAYTLEVANRAHNVSFDITLGHVFHLPFSFELIAADFKRPLDGLGSFDLLFAAVRLNAFLLTDRTLERNQLSQRLQTA